MHSCMLHVARNRTVIAPSRRRKSTHSRLLTIFNLLPHNAFITINYSDEPGNFQEGLLSEKWIAIKDNICTKDMKTTCSSNILKTFRPGYDATVVELLRNSGARLLGKTNGDEFGMGSLSLFSAFRRVINPYRPKNVPASFTANKTNWRSAGGSSGGSAVAATYNICFASLATDTGGSTRLPASYCGVAGFKPSYGLISRWGVIAFADSLDTVGIISSKVKNIQTIFCIVAKYDEKDPTSIPENIREAVHNTCKAFCIPRSLADLSGLRIGIPQEYFPSELGDSVTKPFRRILKALKQRGAVLVPVSLPSTKYALSAYYVLSSAEASSNMARYDGVRFGIPVPFQSSRAAEFSKISDLYAHTRSVRLGEEVKRRILLGTYALTADAFDNYYLKAQELRKLVRRDFNNVFRMPNILQPSESANEDGVDVLLHPTAIRTAPLFSETSELNHYVQDVLTVPASLAGIPAVSIPSIADDGWPVGTSIVGQWGSDKAVLAVAEMIESIISDDSHSKVV